MCSPLLKSTFFIIGLSNWHEQGGRCDPSPNSVLVPSNLNQSGVDMPLDMQEPPNQQDSNLATIRIRFASTPSALPVWLLAMLHKISSQVSSKIIAYTNPKGSLYSYDRYLTVNLPIIRGTEHGRYITTSIDPWPSRMMSD